MPAKHGSLANPRPDLSKAASARISTITRILSMDSEQLKPSTEVRRYLEKCLDDPNRAIDLDQSHTLDLETWQDAQAGLGPSSDQSPRSVFNSRLEKVAWHRMFIHFLKNECPPSKWPSRGHLAFLMPQIDNSGFEEFVRSVDPNPTIDTKQEILRSVSAGLRYHYLCPVPRDGCYLHVDEGILFLLPSSFGPDQWENEINEEQLVEVRRQLYLLGIRHIAESFAGRSCTLDELARRIIDHYVESIESLAKLHSLSQTISDAGGQQAKAKKECTAPSQSLMKNLEKSSETDEIRWTPSESDDLAAEAQLPRELRQAIAENDFTQVAQFTESDPSIGDATPAKHHVPENILPTISTHEESTHDIKPTAQGLLRTKTQETKGIKRPHSPESTLHPQASIFGPDANGGFGKDERRPFKASRYSREPPS
ncbi:MAG: hypothetical protein LQ338_006637 [Usnochroma carphineum]|nr:MAG: hypothetical protein LQ338_006637 [Usnochroma carphineum]